MVDSIPGAIEITNCSLLNDLSALANIRFVKDGIKFSNLDAVTTMSFLPKVDTLRSNLLIEGCDNLTEVAGFDALEYIKDGLYLQNCPTLSNVSGMTKLDSIGGRLAIQYCDQLENYSGLTSLRLIKSNLEIIGCSSITHIDGFKDPLRVEGKVNIRENAMLTSLGDADSRKGLGAIREVHGDIDIFYNKLLKSYCPLKNISTFKGILRASGNGEDVNSLEDIKSACN